MIYSNEKKGFSAMKRGERFQWKHGHKYYYNNTLFMFRYLSYTMIHFL